MNAASVRGATIADASTVAALHAARISGGFLSTLGPRFLTRLYARAVRSQHAFVLVVADASGAGKHDLAGFVAVAEDTGRFYRDFLLHDGVPAGFAAAPALLRRPRRVWETLRYGTASTEDLPAAEVLAIAVAIGAEGRGVGAELLVAAVAELRRRGVPAARVVTAADNVAALRMYERAGFEHRGSTEVHAGVPQAVLVWH